MSAGFYGEYRMRRGWGHDLLLKTTVSKHHYHSKPCPPTPTRQLLTLICRPFATSATRTTHKTRVPAASLEIRISDQTTLVLLCPWLNKIILADGYSVSPNHTAWEQGVGILESNHPGPDPGSAGSVMGVYSPLTSPSLSFPYTK